MKKLLPLSFLIVWLFGVTSPALAQKSSAAEVKRIDVYKKSLDRLTRRRSEPDLIFADTADYDETTEKWRRFNSTKALDKFGETGETYTVAYSWKQNGRIVASNFTRFSPSGDWAQYTNHYFRTDGTLAKVNTELRTFEGDLVVIRDLYFNNKGKLIRKTMRYRDLTTGKPKKPTKEFLGSEAFFGGDPDYYKSALKLPFAALLRNSPNK